MSIQPRVDEDGTVIKQVRDFIDKVQGMGEVLRGKEQLNTTNGHGFMRYANNYPYRMSTLAGQEIKKRPI